MTMTVPLALIIAATLSQQPRDVRPAVKLGTAVLAGVVVTDETPSRPLRRAGVSVLGTDDPQIRLTTTDDSGRFMMPALPAGRYLVTVTKPPYVDTVYGARLPGRPGTQIVLKEGEKRSDLVVRMIRGGAITGVITDEHGQPAVGVGVELVQPQRRPGDQMLGAMFAMLTQMMLPRQTTDDRGMYRFSGVPPGDYIISATPVDLAGGDATVLTPETVQSAVRDLESSSKPASPTPPRPTSTVIGTDERPQRPVQTAGMSFANVSQVGMTGSSGGLLGSTMGYAPVYYPGTTNGADAATITLSAGEERANIDIVARPIPTARIEGIVFGPDGQPARGVNVQLRGENRDREFRHDVLVDVAHGHHAARRFIQPDRHRAGTLHGARPDEGHADHHGHTGKSAAGPAAVGAGTVGGRRSFRGRHASHRSCDDAPAWDDDLRPRGVGRRISSAEP